MTNGRSQISSQQSEISKPNPRASRLVPRASALLLCLLLLGCGPSDGRLALRGTVLVDGAPLQGAAISFRPVGHKANTAGTAIRDGAFTIPAGNGLLPGKYAVSVQAFRATGQSYDDPQRGGKTPVYVPLVFASTEPAEIEIAAGGLNTFEIRLTTK